MSKLLKRISASVFGLLVAAALAVGSGTALARSVTTDCTYNPPAFLGACSSGPECQTACEAWNGVLGVCSGGCCRCYF